MSCIDKDNSNCPFADNEYSCQAQNTGCLPSPYEIVQMRILNGKTWSCHDNPSVPCTGGIRHLKELSLPHKVIDPKLATEDDWRDYV